MRPLPLIGLCAFALAADGVRAQEFLDRVDQALTLSAFDDRWRTRLSGLLDLEGYHFDRPAPGLIETAESSLFNPRLTLFLDSQIGSHVYVFGQGRLDRGFDPIDQGPRARLDEYALRYSPLDDGSLHLQAGKFATVVGNWVGRHRSWENAFITAPIPYENVTLAADMESSASPGDFLSRTLDEKYEYVPVIWGSSYTTGASVAGRLGKFEYAGEVKNAALSSRPESWDATQIGFEHPTFSARLGFRPDLMWNLGVSASSGPYLRPEAATGLPAGTGLGNYREYVLGQDLEFSWRHFQLWAEVYESRFEVPNADPADSVAYYVEGKYKLTPRLFGALRWNQHLFGTMRDGLGAATQWGHDLWRVDTALGFRFTPHTQLKLQYSFQHEQSGQRDVSSLVAAQFTLRF